MQNQYIDNIEARFTPFIKLIMIIFSAIFVFASIVPYRKPPYILLLNKVFIKGFVNISFFSILEIVFIIISLIILKKFGSKYNSSSSISKFIFIFIIINFALKMVNPNNDSNSPILGMPLFSDISNFTFILLAYFSLFLKEKVYMAFLKKLFYYISVILTLRVFYLFFLFGIGKGFYLFGRIHSTSAESDLLIYIAFFQIIFFALYLIYKKKKYLILWLIYLLFLIFSYRRSALAVALSANALSYIFIVLKGKDIKNKILLVLSAIFFFLAINNVESFNLPFKYKKYILRFTSAIPGKALSKTGDFSDKGHWEQTKNTFYSATHTLGFWGKGYGRGDEIYLEGQSLVIHNVYAATWIRYGIYMLIFYLFIILILLYNFSKLFLFEKYKNEKLFILKISVSVFLLMFFLVLSVSSINCLESIKMEMFWFTLLSFVLRVNDKNIRLFFK